MLPKVSYCIFCYNQRDYVADALKSAFAQDYPNLEIIFSDDRSSDGSYERAKMIAGDYTGPHSVVIRQSSENRGLISHVNDVVAAATGEIFIFTAGDDASAPGRTRFVIDALVGSEDGSAAFCDPWPFAGDLQWSKFCEQVPTTTASIRSLPWPEVFKVRGAVAPGALWAYHRSCFDVFGPLPANLISEDSALPIRAALLGSVLHIQQPLLARRDSPKSLNKSNQKYLSKGIINSLREHLSQLDSMCADIQTAKKAGLVSAKDTVEMINKLEKYVETDVVLDPVLRRRGQRLGLVSTLRDIGLLLLMGKIRFAASYVRGRF